MPAKAQEVYVDKPAAMAWFSCLWTASDALAMQPEPIEIIVSAVFGSCSTEEIDLTSRISSPQFPHLALEVVNEFKSGSTRDDVIARIIANRAVRGAAPQATTRQATQPRFLQQ